MKIAITSASGKLGGSIVNHLISEIDKKNVIAIARTPQNASYLGVETRKGDYNNQSDFEAALTDIDTVLLISGMDNPEKRIEQHRNVINAAKKNNVKKIVYTSIIGAEQGNAFSPIVQSNRTTEKDIRESGLDWVIGRNGIYIEPDLEYIDTYKNTGKIQNCANDGKCAYTSRDELGFAYAKMLIGNEHHKSIYNLVGNPITQTELANDINKVFGTNLVYDYVSFEEFLADRTKDLGEFMGTIIAGIYQGIHDGHYDVSSDFIKATGRKHLSAIQMIQDFKAKLNNS